MQAQVWEGVKASSGLGALTGRMAGAGLAGLAAKGVTACGPRVAVAIAGAGVGCVSQRPALLWITMG